MMHTRAIFSVSPYKMRFPACRALGTPVPTQHKVDLSTGWGPPQPANPDYPIPAATIPDSSLPGNTAVHPSSVEADNIPISTEEENADMVEATA